MAPAKVVSLLRICQLASRHKAWHTTASIKPCSAHPLLTAIISVLTAYFLLVASVPAPAASTAGGIVESGQQELYKAVKELVLEYFPKAKVSTEGGQLHFEYRVHPMQNTFTNRIEPAPDMGGILGDVQLTAGPYHGKEPLPKEQNQILFVVLSLSGSSKTHDDHTFARLCYPPDTIQEFLDRFKALVQDIDKLPSHEVAGNAQGSEKTKATAAAPPASSEQAAVQTTPDNKATDKVAPEKKAPDTVQSSASSSPPATIKTDASATINPPASTDSTAKAASKESPTASATPSTKAAPSQPPPGGRRLFFFKATRGNQTVYLLGTIHIATADFYPLAAEIDDAFDQSKSLVVEVAIDRRKIDPAMVQEMVRTSGHYAAPDRLSRHLSPGTRKVFEDYLQWAGETWAMYEEYKPWYVIEMIGASMPRRGEMLKVKGGLGLDNYFLRRAKESNKPVLEFETIDFQLHLHSRLAEEVQDRLLQTTLLNYKDSMANMNELFDTWRAGEPEKMEEIINRVVREHADLAPYNKALFDQRNIGMANKLDEMIKANNNPIFVAVGSAHMLGETGLVEALRKRGFTVDQVYALPQHQLTQKCSPSELRMFSREKFKAFCPEVPQETFLPNLTQYQMVDLTGGVNLILVLELPTNQANWSIPGPLLLDKLLAALVTHMHGVVTTRHSYLLQDCACREINFYVTAPAAPPAGGKGAKTASPAKPSQGSDMFSLVKQPAGTAYQAKVRACLFQNRVYILIAAGKKGWLESSNTDKFMNSLEVIK